MFHYLHLQQGRNDLRELWRSRESVYYNGRIYGAVKYLMENNKTEDHDTFDIGIQVGQNQLHRFHNKTIPIKEHKDIEAKYKFTVPIKRTVSQNGITVTIDRLEHRLGGNRLYLTADEHRIFGISGEVDNQRFSKFKYQGFNNDNGNEFNLPIKSSDQLPDQMNVELNELHLVTDQSLTFEVDASNIEYQEKVIINKRIGEVFGFSYFINHLEYNGDGLFVYLRKENRTGYHNYEIPMPVSPNSPEFNNITIINSNGEEIKDQYFRTDVRPHENLIGFTIPSDGEKYQIKFSDILIRTKFYDKFNVEIKKQ
ncbi:hypothetical protein [Piscibacillus salipiscarius]|uniref:hypothetical protein n=1 Tax=Piscibacillus salipiscarius TaxID=299480 RepID=UPI002436EF93|nr:hypothetical protein [Piscibacillus salipiscarius]